jgi:xanthine dehydrogenase accessory factor
VKLTELVIAIKGAGEMASAVAWRLYKANMQRIVMMDIPAPLAVRRGVSFCEALHDGSQTVEGVESVKVEAAAEINRAWKTGRIPVIADPDWKTLRDVRPAVVVDAILAKRNLGTRRAEARLVIGLGPGFSAGEDVHVVIETNRGHDLGRIISSGSAEPDTGVPGAIAGVAGERVLRAPVTGEFCAERRIADAVLAGDIVGRVEGEAVTARVDGVLRGLIRTRTRVEKNIKLGDIDPRGDARACYTISDKARAIAGSVLEAVLRVYNVS